MVFPELLRGILAGDALENLLAACEDSRALELEKGVSSACWCDVLDGWEGVSLTRVVVLELGHIVDILVNNDPEGVGLVVRRYVACTERLGHGGRILVHQVRRW